ncbi:hypothetical protein ABK040_003029 [Willaertia magna]
MTVITKPFEQQEAKKEIQELKELIVKEFSTFTPYQKYFLFGDNEIIKLKGQLTKELITELTTDNKAFTSCLLRYLRARDFKVEKAHQLLKGTLQWLEEFKPYQFRSKQMSSDTDSLSGKIYVHGFDKWNRPLVRMNPSKQKDFNSELQIKTTVYALQSAINRMEDPNLGQLSWFVDFEGFQMKHSPSLSVCKSVIDILLNHFVERLGYCIVVNAPKAFHWLWSLLSPFIPSVTKEKVKICWSSDKEEQLKFLKQFIDLKYVDKKFCDESEFEFNHEEIWNEDEELDNKRVEKLKKFGVVFE